MKKLLFAFMLIICATATVSAQKQPTKKAVPKKKEAVPPPILRSEAEGYDNTPTIMESPGQVIFDRERICPDCDTLVLEAGKPRLLIYDVKWMADHQSRTYRKQPTPDDLGNDYYAMRGLVQREWEELRTHFPEGDFGYHHVYRNTFIKILNDKQETLNLLNRQEAHEGFLYWSGKPADIIVQQKTMAQLTERVARARGGHEVSSYYSGFLRDSSAIAGLQPSTGPAPGIAENMNTLLLDELFGELVLPVQFFNIADVRSITIQSVTEKEKKVTLSFNKQGQLTEWTDHRDRTRISYKDKLPYAAVSNDRTILFYYHGDTVILKKPERLELYKLVGHMLLNTRSYTTGKTDYETRILNGGITTETELSDNTACIKNTNNATKLSWTTCYSNTEWRLPMSTTEVMTGTNEYENRHSTTTFSKDNAATFSAETINEQRSGRIEYQMQGSKIIQMASYEKRAGEEYGNPYRLTVTYEYFK